jgi:uncharacterized membrane protein
MFRAPMIPASPGGRVGSQGYIVHVGGHLGAFGILWTVLGIVLWVALMTVLVLIAIELIRGFRRPKAGESKPGSPAESAEVTAPPAESCQAAAPPADSGAMAVLEKRFARGDISREEYLERKAVLTGE